MLSELKKAIRAIIVMILTAIAMVSVNRFADTFWMPGLEVGPSKAVSMISPVYWLVAYIGISMGVEARPPCPSVSPRPGRAGQAACPSGSFCTWRHLSSCGCCWIPIIDVVGASEVSGLCVSYVLLILVLFSAIVLEFIIGGMLRAEDTAKKSTVIQSFAAVLNMVMDPISITAWAWASLGRGWQPPWPR